MARGERGYGINLSEIERDKRLKRERKGGEKENASNGFSIISSFLELNMFACQCVLYII